MRFLSNVAGFCVIAVLVVSLGCNDDHTSPTEPLSMSVVTVQVARSCAQVTGDLEIVLDGNAMGTVAPGSSRDLGIEGTGEHELVLHPDLGNVDKFELTIFVGSPGEHFTADTSCENGGANLMLTRN